MLAVCTVVGFVSSIAMAAVGGVAGGVVAPKAAVPKAPVGVAAPPKAPVGVAAPPKAPWAGGVAAPPKAPFVPVGFAPVVAPPKAPALRAAKAVAKAVAAKAAAKAKAVARPPSIRGVRNAYAMAQRLRQFQQPPSWMCRVRASGWLHASREFRGARSIEQGASFLLISAGGERAWWLAKLWREMPTRHVTALHARYTALNAQCQRAVCRGVGWRPAEAWGCTSDGVVTGFL